MKKSYIKIISLEVLIIIVAILIGFDGRISTYNCLIEYSLVIFLSVLVLLFKVMFGFEKNKYKHIEDIILEMLKYIIIYYLLYYLCGIFIGYTSTHNYYSLYGIGCFIIPIILSIILKEYLRYNLLCKLKENNLLIIFSCITFIILDLVGNISINAANNNYQFFLFIAKNLLPIVSINIGCTYLSKKLGYIPGIVLRLSLMLVPYVLPIIPNLNIYLKILIDSLIPIIIILKMNQFLGIYRDNKIERNYYRLNFLLLIIPIFIVTTVVYFSSGYFKYYAVAIASGSMSETILKGDVVIIEQIKDNYDQIDIGDIIAFKHDSIMIVHRVIKIENDRNKFYFYTKGDANSEEDNYKIEESDIVGVVKYKIDKIGYPAIWLSEL